MAGRVFLRLLAIVIAVLAPAGVASAGPLVSASLRVQVGTLPAVTFVASGASGTALSNLQATVAAGNAFAGTLTTTTPTTAAPPISGIYFTAQSNAKATFAGTAPGSVGGVALFPVQVRVTGLGGLTLLAVPLNFGSPSTFAKSAGGISVSAIAAPWTVGPVTVTGLGNSTSPVTAMATGSNALTLGGVGTLILVSPVKIVTNIAGNLVSFGRLTLVYAPEPGTVVLLGMGVAALGLLGRRGLGRGSRAG